MTSTHHSHQHHITSASLKNLWQQQTVWQFSRERPASLCLVIVKIEQFEFWWRKGTLYIRRNLVSVLNSWRAFCWSSHPFFKLLFMSGVTHILYENWQQGRSFSTVCHVLNPAKLSRGAHSKFKLKGFSQFCFRRFSDGFFEQRGLQWSTHHTKALQVHKPNTFI